MPGPLATLSGTLPAAGAIVLALLAAGALALTTRRARTAAMALALILAPVLLVGDIWDSPQVRTLRGHPAALVVGAGLALVLLLGAAWFMLRHPRIFPLAAVVALPFRIPIAVGGQTANLLVPLYFVIAAGALACIVANWRRGGDIDPDDDPFVPRALERLLALAVVLYAVQATYSSDFQHALQTLVFFYVPFSLLFVQLTWIVWDRKLLRRCLEAVTALALLFAAIGFYEYATKRLLLNPRLVVTNDIHTYFRVNSVFFDPNIYGRFLAMTMIAIAAVMIWTQRGRIVIACAAVLAVLWGGLLTTLSQSSLGALLIGSATLAALRWSVKRTLAVVGVVALVAAAAVVATPSTFGVHFDNLNLSSSGRAGLIKGGVKLFSERPILGFGPGSFEKEYRKRHRVSPEATGQASHTIPITVAAEQGLVGFAVYVALLVAAFIRLFRGARRTLARSAFAAAFTGLVLHTFLYAAFLEDPMTWTILGIGTALAWAANRPEAEQESAHEQQNVQFAPL